MHKTRVKHLLNLHEYSNNALHHTTALISDALVERHVHLVWVKMQCERLVAPILQLTHRFVEWILEIHKMKSITSAQTIQITFETKQTLNKFLTFNPSFKNADCKISAAQLFWITRTFIVAFWIGQFYCMFWHWVSTKAFRSMIQMKCVDFHYRIVNEINWMCVTYEYCTPAYTKPDCKHSWMHLVGVFVVLKLI